MDVNPYFLGEIMLDMVGEFHQSDVQKQGVHRSRVFLEAAGAMACLYVEKGEDEGQGRGKLLSRLGVGARRLGELRAALGRCQLALSAVRTLLASSAAPTSRS